MRRWRRAAEREREVDGWRASGLTAAQYAARRGYSVESLRRWTKKAVASKRMSAPQFVRLEIAASPRNRALVVEVGAGRILVEPGFDAEHLRAVVAALAEKSAC
jgi:hypothetical protein